MVLTQGDPAGIGPELALRAWAGRAESGAPRFALIADPDLMRRTAQRLGLAIRVVEVASPDALDPGDDALPVIPTGHSAAVEPGLPEPASAAGTIASIDMAAQFVRDGRAAAMVTNPIAKSVLYAAGFTHPGHTEYLAELANRLWGVSPLPVMMLWSETLAVVPITIHVPLRRVPDLLTTELIVDTARIVARDMAARFGLPRPRLAFSGLNPHAGEGGALGLEDDAVIRPAVEQLRAEGLDVTGPLPADTMFHARARARYDVALCMYHDQALIPIKALAFDDGVNVTLGLPFVRTSPDHGTAFDIAGRGVARPDSLIAALRLAGRLSVAGTP
nr:4-hydroxythreonine-4-phosphate dehydrogenase PdxA [Alsobacter ponti]